ncbi:MAG: YbhB/YbcL family Raf kinase inhibitor-like protein [Bacteroidota bacterium]
MKITSSAFHDKNTIPTKYAYQGIVGGKNISIPVSWSDVPAGTESFALSIVDPHPVAKNWVHWFVINIPNHIKGLPEGASMKLMPKQSKELMSTYGTIGYGGPEPPKGSGAHPYVVTLYALNTTTLELRENTTLPEFTKALEGKTIATATITGMFEQ